MSHEGINKPESYESLYRKALTIGQSMSAKWKEIPKGDHQIWQAFFPDFANIYGYTSKEKGGKTGIQRFFEGRMEHVEQQGEAQKEDNIRRLIIELEKYQKEMNEITSGSY